MRGGGGSGFGSSLDADGGLGDSLGGYGDSKGTGGNDTFLVVDESPTIRLLAKEMLAKLGYAESDIHVTASPTDALKQFVEKQPAVVFIELDHSEEDGLPVALAMLEKNPYLKLVVLTADDRTAERVRRVVRAGAFAVIEKPLRHDKIRAAIADLQMEDGGVERLR